MEPRHRLGTSSAVAALMISAALLSGAGTARAAPARGVWPVQGPVVGRYDPPSVRWGAGHRGVDIAAPVGSVVRALRGGIVTVAEVIVSRGVVVVDHGALRSTFEPVTPLVAEGDWVVQGQAIARLDAGHACAAPACLHWGVKQGPDYRNPLSLLGGEVRLLSSADARAVRSGSGG